MNQQMQQLDEGLMDVLKVGLKKAITKLGNNRLETLAKAVKEITGGNYSTSKENALKVAKALGITVNDVKGLADKSPKPAMEGLAGNAKGIALQLMHLATIGAGAATVFADATTGNLFFDRLVVAAGIVAIMATEAFWGSEPGQVGSWGKKTNEERSQFPKLQALAEMKQAPLDLPKTPIDRFLPTHVIDKAEIVKALDLAKKKTGLDLATLPAKDIGDKVKEIRKVLLDIADEDLDLSAAVMHIFAALWKLSKRR